MTTYQQFLGQFYIGTDADSITAGGTAAALTNGWYYICGYTGETTKQLCEHIQVQMRAARSSTDTVAYSGSTGKITITLSTAGTLTMDSALAAILGFTGCPYTSGTTFVAERQPRYVWRPSRSAWDYPVNLYATTFWPPRSTSVVGRADDGTTWGVQGSLLYDAVITYRALTEAEVKTPLAGTTYADFQQWWTDCVHTTRPVRWYWDRTQSASYDYLTFVFGKEEQEKGLGSWLDFSSRHIKSYNALWDVEIPMMKHVAA